VTSRIPDEENIAGDLLSLPLHCKPCFDTSVSQRAICRNERARQGWFCLPMFPGTSSEEQATVVSAIAIAEFYS